MPTPSPPLKILQIYKANPVNAVIVQAKPGRFGAVSRLLDAVSLTSSSRRNGPFGLIQRLAQSDGAFFSPGPLQEFNMYAALLDAPTAYSVETNPDVAQVYADLPCSVLGYPVVDKNGTYSAVVSSGTMYFTSTMYIRRVVGADLANAAGYDGTGQTVAVVDSGGDETNPALHGMRKMSVYPANYADLNGHGSHVAATIGGALVKDHLFSSTQGRLVRMQGMAPGCSLIGVKALGFVVGIAPTSALLRGLQMAVQAGADVINCSWGSSTTGPDISYDPFAPVAKAIDAKGILMVCAAGNTGPKPGTLNSPGCLPEPLSVAAYNVLTNKLSPMFGDAGTPCGFSSRGPSPYVQAGNKPDMIMPGAIYDSAIMGAYPTMLSTSYTARVHLYQALAGTSQAAPVAAGLLTCMRQAFKERTGKPLTNTIVRQMLASSGNVPDTTQGYGVLTWGLFKAWMQSAYGVGI